MINYWQLLMIMLLFTALGVCLLAWFERVITTRNLDYVDRIVGEHHSTIDGLKKQHASDLETAMCLWEEINRIIDLKPTSVGSKELHRYAGQVQETFTILGSSALRSKVATWVPLIEIDWEIADNPSTNEPGQYAQSFDWDFVPHWIGHNVDWSDPRNPTVRRIKE